MSTSPPPPANPANPAPKRKRGRLISLLVLLLLIGGGVGGYVWWKRTRLPQPGSETYDQYVSAFYVSLAALDVDISDVAEANLNRAVDLVPAEPAGWANRGLNAIRRNRLPEAERDLKRARQLAPDDPTIAKLFGFLESTRGKYPEAAAEFRRAIERDPNDAEALFQLAQALKRENPDGSRAEYLQLLNRILALRPNNLFILRERLQNAAQQEDRPIVEDCVARLKKFEPNWTEQTRTEFAKMEKLLAPDKPLDFLDTMYFSNVLLAEPAHRRSIEEFIHVDLPAGTPLRKFLRLENPSPNPSPPDTELRFTEGAIPDAPPGNWDSTAAIWLSGEATPTVFFSSAAETRSTKGHVLPAGGKLLAVDWNNDMRTDLLAYGPAGLRFFQQDTAGQFQEVTAKTKLPDAVLKRDYAASLAVDVDLDGDIDILLAPRSGKPIALRNNFDGTFKVLELLGDAADARAFAWADFDHDGAPDVAILDAKGKLRVFANERSGRFKPWPVALPTGEFLAIAVADANDDGVLDLIAVRRDGALLRIADVGKRASWNVQELGKWTAAAGEPGEVRLFSEDVDNNGVSDFVVSSSAGSAAWLGAAGSKYEPITASLPARISAVADLDGDGRLDLLAANSDGKPARFLNSGSKPYHWQRLRFEAAPVVDRTGDNRINSFGIGGDIEVRAGTFVTKRPVTAPVVHFGLGTRTQAEVLRITWPNGGSQVEFDRPADTTIQAQQRLKGSCPFLFTWDGEKFVFVADFMWSTPLGMYINAQDPGGLVQTLEWVRIPGEKLKPRDGHYEVRVNANLWETHYFDHLALHAVDHPPGTELYSDERFALEPFTPVYRLMEATRPVARASDHLGADATEVVKAVDGVYLDRAGRGLYQGITRDHWVEVDLGDDAPREGPVWLVAHGWIHPTDSSINYALEQGTNERPRALSLEVPDGAGGWKTVRNGIGFPSGKNKTVLIRLDGVNGPGVSRRFRLRTNLEIYWDALHYARGRNDAEVKKTELLPVAADLRFRGILAMSQANRSSPELPDYDRIETRSQVWRDLIGYHTRFGDIRELIEKVDDRYAILTAGDDVALKFRVPPDPPPGWKRDFIWVSDGWVKDGDLNTLFGKTVLPLPYHGMPSYDRPPGKLEDDPVYRRHKKDWDVFHTRYVSPAGFERGLRPRSSP